MDALTRAGYLAHAQSVAYGRRLAETRRLLREAARLGRPALMISGGKDSLVLSDIARHEFGNDVEGFFIDSGAEHPAALAVIEALRQRSWRIETVYPERSIVEMLKLIGGLGYSGPEQLPGEWHWAGSDWKRILITEPAAAIRERGYPVTLLGLRADESRPRAMSMRRYGPIRTRRDGAVIACPLAWWTGADVMAYALAHNLPLSEIYLREGETSPERRRTGTLLGDTSTRYGRWAELRHMWPDVWMRLIEIFPEMSRWS
ncbi:MAG TPA: phosphoadenosine phosphosulfate reductase family protein [Stellaceae bacterium]|nr:phosphoadenosine phosphosulfate reductase family protein [Stellaceae bacterium]